MYPEVKIRIERIEATAHVHRDSMNHENKGQKNVAVIPSVTTLTAVVKKTA
jgi:hypothetical protein